MPPIPDDQLTGVWERERVSLPPALSDIEKLRRAGREVVHLSYHRLTVDDEAKDWDCGEIYGEIADELARLADVAMPSRMDAEARGALRDLVARDANVGPASVAKGAVYGLAVQGGTVAFPGFQAGS